MGDDHDVQRGREKDKRKKKKKHTQSQNTQNYKARRLSASCISLASSHYFVSLMTRNEREMELENEAIRRYACA